MIWEDDFDDIYVNEHGKCAYIAGVIRVHTDNLDINGEIAQTYLWMLFNIMFVEYENHLLMFLHGSCE